MKERIERAKMLLGVIERLQQQVVEQMDACLDTFKPVEPPPVLPKADEESSSERWSDEEKEFMRAFAAEGMVASELAGALGRSESSVMRWALRHLGIRLKASPMLLQADRIRRRKSGNRNTTSKGCCRYPAWAERMIAKAVTEDEIRSLAASLGRTVRAIEEKRRKMLETI